MIVLNPSSVKEVEIDGALFKIGVVPFGKKVEFQSKAHLNKDKHTAQEIENLFFQNYDYVQWGVKGHSGLKFPDGAEVPFKTQKTKIGDTEYQIVSEETMEIYASNISFLTKLCNHVTKMNYMSEQEAKN